MVEADAVVLAEDSEAEETADSEEAIPEEEEMVVKEDHLKPWMALFS